MEGSTPPAPAMPPGPLGGSFAWRAGAFHDYDSWALHVTPADVAEIEAAAAATRAAGLDIRRIERGKLRGGTVIAPDREWIVPLEAETPAY